MVSHYVEKSKVGAFLSEQMKKEKQLTLFTEKLITRSP